MFSAVVIGMIMTACGGGASSAKAETDENQEKAQAYQFVERLVRLLEGEVEGKVFMWENSEPVYEDVDHILLLLLSPNVDGEYRFVTTLAIQDPAEMRIYEYETTKVEHYTIRDGRMEILGIDEDINNGLYMLHTAGKLGSPYLDVYVAMDSPMPRVMGIEYDGRMVDMELSMYK